MSKPQLGKVWLKAWTAAIHRGCGIEDAPEFADACLQQYRERLDRGDFDPRSAPPPLRDPVVPQPGKP